VTTRRIKLASFAHISRPRVRLQALQKAGMQLREAGTIQFRVISPQSSEPKPEYLRAARARAARVNGITLRRSRDPREIVPVRPLRRVKHLLLQSLEHRLVRPAFSPRRSNSRSCRTRNIFGCRLSGISPISSSRIVATYPPVRTCQAGIAMAPVKAPRP